MDVQGVSLSTANSVDVQVVCIPFHSQQYGIGHAGCIHFHSQQYRRAGKSYSFFLCQSWRKQLDGLQAHFHSKSNFSNLPKYQISHIRIDKKNMTHFLF
jgi:hypothetical protein